MNSRRQFLKWLGLSSGASLIGFSSLSCGNSDGLSESNHHGDKNTANNNATTTNNLNNSVDGIDTNSVDSASCEVTGKDVQGPYYESGAPERIVLADESELGERLLIEGVVYDSDCVTPVAGAILDIWQADSEGNYHSDQDYRLRGQMKTSSQGEYRFETIRPGHYPLGNSMRPAHIHFTVISPDHKPLTTQLYFAGDPYLSPNDPCGSGCNSGDATLIIDLAESTDNFKWSGSFNIILEKT